jgi:hypothetical protein
MKSVPTMFKNKFGWDIFGWVVDWAHPVGMAGGGNQMHRSYVCLVKGCEVIPFLEY